MVKLIELKAQKTLLRFKYEGTAAPQIINGGAGKLLGGGNQIYIPRGEVNPSWFGN